MLSYIKQGDNIMTNEFEAWLEKVTYCSPPRILYRLNARCRICGDNLQDGEIDICDGCFDSEQVRM